MKDFIIGTLIGFIGGVVVVCNAVDHEYFHRSRLNICAKNNISVAKCLVDGKEIP